MARLTDRSRVRLKSRCIRIEEQPTKIIARFAAGYTSEADFLVGADGLHSVVRAQLFGNVAARYAGYTCWRGVAQMDGAELSHGTAFEAWGQGRRFAVLHCGAGRLFWFATLNAPAHEVDGSHGRKADVRELFWSWHKPIAAVIEATSEILRNDIVDRPPTTIWGRGRITLLGDAAHPMTPNPTFATGAEI